MALRMWICVFLWLAGWVCSVHAQQDATSQICLPNTEFIAMTSETNQVDYQLYISLPPDYQTANKAYPVLYLLDADYTFALAKNMADHLAMHQQMTGLVIVGIAYQTQTLEVNRTRDYTPTQAASGTYGPQIQKQHAGGGPAFQSFLRDELIPHIYERYRVTAQRALAGHAYGGLFCAWSMLMMPELFTGYIMVSPSLWYDDHFLFRLQDNLHTEVATDTKIYLSAGDLEVNHQWNMPLDLEAFYSILMDKKVRKLHLKKSIEKQQTHHSIFPIGLSNGLRYIFDAE